MTSTATQLYPFLSADWIAQVENSVAGNANATDPSMTFTINVVVTNPPAGTLAQSSLSVAFGRLTVSAQPAANPDVQVSGSYMAIQAAWNGLVEANAPSLYRGFTLGRYSVMAYTENGWNGLNAFVTRGLFVGDPITANRLTVGNGSTAA